MTINDKTFKITFICDAPARNESHCTFVDSKLGTSLSSENRRQKNNFLKENLPQLLHF